MFNGHIKKVTTTNKDEYVEVNIVLTCILKESNKTTMFDLIGMQNEPVNIDIRKQQLSLFEADRRDSLMKRGQELVKESESLIDEADD